MLLSYLSSAQCEELCLSRRSPKLSAATPGLTPTLSLSGSLLHVVGVLLHDIHSGLNTARCDWVPCATSTAHSLPSLRVTQTPPPGKETWQNQGGREVENKAEPKLICHSLAGVLTIIGCHHFLIRPVSKKCSNKTALQRDPPYCTHTHTHTGVLLMDVHIGARRTNTSNMSESADPKNKTSLVSRWNGCFPLQGHPS